MLRKGHGGLYKAPTKEGRRSEAENDLTKNNEMRGGTLDVKFVFQYFL